MCETAVYIYASNTYRGNLLCRSDISPQKFELVGPFNGNRTFLINILGLETPDSAAQRVHEQKKTGLLLVQSLTACWTELSVQ